MKVAANTLGRHQRLRRSAQFAQVYTRGRRISGPHLTIFYLPNQLDYNRLGLSVGKKRFKLSCQRHFIQRCLREAFRLNKRRFFSGYDLVLSVHRLKVQKQARPEIAQEMLALAKKARLLNKNAY